MDSGKVFIPTPNLSITLIFPSILSILYPLSYVRDIQEFENNFEECGLYFNIDWSYERDGNKVNAQCKNWK